MRYMGVIPIIVLLSSCATRPAATAPERWAAAVLDRDYVALRSWSRDSDLLFTTWQAVTEEAHRHGYLERYTIVSEVDAGSTTHYCIEFQGSDPQWPVHRTEIYADVSGKISAPNPYSPGRCAE